MNPARQTYDYQNGRGLDGFLSAAIDEVSWETNLESTFNTLSQAPIGQSAYSNTAINYDQAQQTGSQGGTVSVGGAGGGSAGTGGSGNFTIDPANSQIRVADGTNSRIEFGLMQDGAYGMKVSAAGSDTTSNNLIFTSEQIIGSRTVPATTLIDPGSGTIQNFQFAVPHNYGFTPKYEVQATIPNNFGSSATTGFPGSFYTAIGNFLSVSPGGATHGYTYFTGIDDKNLYLALQLSNTAGDTYTFIPVTFVYYISKIKAV